MKESDLDNALRRLFRAQMKLGVYDPPQRLPWAGYTYETIVNSPKHQQLALEAARKSIVLLKNESGTLPLKKGLGSIAVIGPNADEAEVLAGNYNGTPVAPVTVLAGIRAAAGPGTKVTFARGGPLATGLPGPARRAGRGALDRHRRRPQARPHRRLLPRPLRRRARADAGGRRDRLRLGGPGARRRARRRRLQRPLDGRDHRAGHRPLHPRHALRDAVPHPGRQQAGRPGPLRPRARHDHGRACRCGRASRTRSGSRSSTRSTTRSPSSSGRRRAAGATRWRRRWRPRRRPTRW